MKKTAALKIVACLAVLTLLGITALAGGSRSGFVTINGGRQTVALAGQSRIYIPPAPDEAPMSKIFSNLGPAGNVYQCCIGWTISAVGSIVGQQNWIAEGFTPAADATVFKVKVAVGYVTGTNGVTIALAQDAGGIPGTILRKWNKTGLPTFGTCCTLIAGKDVNGIPVSGGTQYWLVVKTSGKTPDTWDAFNFSNSGLGPLANNTGNGWQNLGDGNSQGAFAVLGQ